ncbi:MAG TPA: cell envelope integrity protein CreD [Rhodocyclaceae bacterium]|nr:cell envelope integrity protein CreD [Rhodocyclaceae bacterium]
MQKKLLMKVVAIVVLSLLLLIPLAMIEAQIGARSARQDEVTRNIAESSAGPQTLVGPVILVRYRERVERRSKDESSGRETVRQEIVEHTRTFPPQDLDLGGEVRVESLKRGLYRVRLYHLAAQLAGTAVIPPRLGLDANSQLVDAQAVLVMGITDPRGVETDPEVRVNGQPRRFSTGTAGAVAGQGVHIELGEIDPAAGANYEFSFPLKLTGLERLAIAPAGNSTRVSLKSDWPHPSFQGRFLPQQRTVGADGFTAQWQVSHLARNFDRVLKAGQEAGGGETLGISLIDPVNVYLKSERAVKYGILFVILTFAAFFLTEILRRLAIHPLQYLLVGLALAMFFLLLIALSEHVDFLLAYGVSAAACVALIGAYLAGALGSRLRGAAFGAGIAALYGVLYGVLLSEDNALLMGTLLLFLALGATMLSTRRLDWYRIGGLAGDEAP